MEKDSKTGAQLIAEERKRQIEEEGYTLDHDMNCNDVKTLAQFGISYAFSAIGQTREAIKICPYILPYFKPKTMEQDLVRAGALIAAAIDRLHSKQKNYGKRH